MTSTGGGAIAEATADEIDDMGDAVTATAMHALADLERRVDGE